jgi:hypothetical protein
VIQPYSPTEYKLNEPRAEVYYTLEDGFGPRRLTDCNIFSQTDWTCAYPDGKKIVVRDGLEAISAADAYRPYGPSFYLRRWQWCIAKIMWFLGERPQGDWLIPEQQERY